MDTHSDIHAHRILILDFGSQYTQLIARRVREAGVYCEIHPWDMEEGEIRVFHPRGVILSGGPETVTADFTPRVPSLVGWRRRTGMNTAMPGCAPTGIRGCYRISRTTPAPRVTACWTCG